MRHLFLKTAFAGFFAASLMLGQAFAAGNSHCANMENGRKCHENTHKCKKSCQCECECECSCCHDSKKSMS